MAYPPDRKYTKDHEWIRIAGDTGERPHDHLALTIRLCIRKEASSILISLNGI